MGSPESDAPAHGVQRGLGAPDQQPAGIQSAVRQLSAFSRVTLRPGQSQQVSLHVPLRQLQYWSTKNGKWVTATGKRTVSVGGSSRNLPLNQGIEGID